MSFSRLFVCASFASGLMAFTLHTAGIAKANPSTLTDGSYGENQVGQQGAGNPSTGLKGTAEAESSMRMQSEKNSPSGGSLDPKAPNAMGQSGREQGDTKSGGTGREDSSTGRSNRPSSPSGSGSMGGGSGAGGSAPGGVAR